MKKLVNLVSILLVVFMFVQCNNNPKIEYVYKTVVDSSAVQVYLAKIDSLELVSCSMVNIINAKDSIITSKNKEINYLQDELEIADYKLERIKEYNRIAAKGNNIKYLRGWINRVLND